MKFYVESIEIPMILSRPNWPFTDSMGPILLWKNGLKKMQKLEMFRNTEEINSIRPAEIKRFFYLCLQPLQTTTNYLKKELSL